MSSNFKYTYFSIIFIIVSFKFRQMFETENNKYFENDLFPVMKLSILSMIIAFEVYTEQMIPLHLNCACTNFDPSVKLRMFFDIY